MKTKKNKLQKKILLNTIGATFLLNAACTNKWNNGAIETQGQSIRSNIQLIEPSMDYELTKDSKINRQDLEKLEYFLLNSSFSTDSKISFIKEYINYLSDTYNISKDEVAKNIEDYFQLPTEGNILNKLRTARPFLVNLKKDISVNLGIVKPIDDQMAEKIKFTADSDEIKKIRGLNYYEQLKLVMASQKAKKVSIAVFKSLDDDAKKLANQALADIAKNQQKDLADKVKWISTLKEKEKRVESLKLAAEMASQTDAKDEAEKKSMTAYFYSAIQEGVADPKQFSNDLLLNISDPKVLNSASKLGKISYVLSKYSETKRDKLLDISKQLNQFSQDGNVKIDLTNLTGDSEFKKHAGEFSKKVAGYIDDGQEILNLAKTFGVDPEFCDKAQQAIDLAGKGVKFVEALASPNPLAVVGAVSGLLGAGSAFGQSSGPSRTELELKQLQAKMDLMITLQNRTLDEIAKTRQDIEDLKKLAIKLVELVGSLSVQVAESSQTLYNEIEKVYGAVNQTRELTKAILRSPLSNCFENDDLKSIKLFRPETLVSSFKGHISGCFQAMSLIDYLDDSQINIFRSIDKEETGDLYKRSIQVFNADLKTRNKNEYFKFYSTALNPVQSLKNFLNDMAPDSFYKSEALDKQVDFIRSKQVRSDDYLEPSFLSAFVTNIIKFSPFYSLYQTDLLSGSLKDLLNADVQKADSVLFFYERILKFTNLSIIQRSFMDGVQISDISLDDMKKINAEPNKDCSLNQNIDSKKCFYQLNPIARKNLLKLLLVKEMQSKNRELNVYTTLFGADTNETKILFENYFDNDTWLFEIIDGKVKAKVAGVYEEVPTADDMIVPEFSYSLEMKLMLAARENLIELIADMKQNRIEDDDVRRLLMQATLRKAL